MEGLDSVWQVFLLSLGAGALIGALGYRLFNPISRQLDQMKAERDSANLALETYKEGVGEHFDKTSQLVNDLTQNYVKVYQHLAEGAQTLGAGKSFNNLLEQNQGKVSLAVEDKSVVTEVMPERVIVDAMVEQAVETDTPADYAEATPENPDDEEVESPEGQIERPQLKE